MEARTSQQDAGEIQGDLHVVLRHDGEEVPAIAASAPGAEEAKASFKRLTLLRPDAPARVLVAGAGKRDDLDAERLRTLGALVAREAARLEARNVVAELADAADAAAFTEGVILGAYRFDRFRSPDPDDPPAGKLESLTVTTGEDAEEPVRIAATGAEAANRARELQNLPANYVTPSVLAERAEEIAAAHESVTAEILGREEIVAKGLGGLAAVASGTEEEPRLITLRYTGGGSGETLGFVGKAVTFDSGGISIKPSGGMHEMKMDMSGGAAVLEAVAAIAELQLAIDLVAVVPSTENMPSGTAMRPGDVITQLNGKTVEVNNTDAEGRLILADALTWCVREMGADRVIDLATLTGAVIIALGSTYAALLSNDDDLVAAVEEASAASGELCWRLPLHPDYKKLTTGTVADLTNAASKREAGTIYAASFLEEFVDGKPWAHVDIAGTAWDTPREHSGKGPTGFGVRLLLAHALAAAGKR